LKNVEFTLGTTLECFLVGYITLQPSLALTTIICDLEILYVRAVFQQRQSKAQDVKIQHVFS